ncbi:MAG: response regulator transcription factor [Oscillospiraceae bacterium]|nr:response regulator transcription factor [Oscillospiraceae bacterium]
MINIAICDDDNHTCSELERIILDYEQSNIIQLNIEVFYSGESLINFIKEDHRFDLIFLDIELGSTTGIIVGNKIRKEFDDHISKIIFITSKGGYEQELFDIQPFNFLKKPIQKEKVKKCINLAIHLLEIYNQIFEYKKGYDIIRISIKNILYFESKRKKIKIVTDKGEDQFYGTLENIKERLPRIFVKPHGSFLINFEKVERVTKEFAFIVGGIKIPISQRNLKKIREMIIDFEREKNVGL